MSSEPLDVPEGDNLPESDVVHLIQTEDGLLAVGRSQAVLERSLRARGLLDQARNVSIERLVPYAQMGSAIVRESVGVVGGYGMWLKLTPESARAVSRVGLMDCGVEGVRYAMLGEPGNIKGWISVQDGVVGTLTNPALIGGAAGLLAQAVKQQDAAELKALLVSIDGKLDQVLRNQRNDLIADIAGLEDLVRRAFVVRGQRNTIDATTWSQVDGATLAATTTLRRALGRIDALAVDLEAKKNLNAISEAVGQAKSEAQVWLSVVARCFMLMDETAVLELDRIMEEEPDAVNLHRLALSEFREQYRDEVISNVVGLMSQMDAAARRADLKQVIHRPKAAATVKSVESAKRTVSEAVQSIGLDIATEVFDMIDWIEALKSPAHRKAALKEASAAALIGLGSAALAGVGYVAAKKDGSASA